MPITKFWAKAKRFILDERIALFAMLFTVLIVAKNQSEKWHQWSDKNKTYRPIVRSDGSGYYAYLPQIFIYKDKRYNFLETVFKRYPNGKMAEFGHIPSDGNGRLNKYFVGVSVCQAPFFIATHALNKKKYISDGYSLPYQKSVAIGAIFFLLLGIWLSYLVLLHCRISPWIGALSITAFVLGTPLLYYAVNDPLTAHAYSFTLISLFLFSLISWKKKRNLQWLLMVAFSYGMVIILRPSNGIVFLLYFAVFPNLKESVQFLVQNLFKKIGHLLPAIAVFSLVLFLQLANVHYQTGEWGFNIYENEGFTNWNKPPFWEVLFGFRKGLFIYAPLCLIGSLGLIFFRNKHALSTKFIFIFLALFTYVTASWWCWWYGGSIGMRPFIDVSLFFILGLALLLQHARKVWSITLLPIIVFCIYYQFVLTIQMETGILHFSEMNKERFVRVFLKTDNRFQWVFHVDQPKKLDSATSPYSYWNFSDLSKSFVGTAKYKPDDYVLEHMKIETLAQHTVDSSYRKLKGLRIYTDMSISDHHNTPWFLFDIYKNGEWKEVYVDFIGMRIPSLHKAFPIKSDWVFSDEVYKADSLRIRLHNTHGETTLRGLRYDFL